MALALGIAIGPAEFSLGQSDNPCHMRTRFRLAAIPWSVHIASDKVLSIRGCQLQGCVNARALRENRTTRNETFNFDMIGSS